MRKQSATLTADAAPAKKQFSVEISRSDQGPGKTERRAEGLKADRSGTTPGQPAKDQKPAAKLNRDANAGVTPEAENASGRQENLTENASGSNRAMSPEQDRQASTSPSGQDQKSREVCTSSTCAGLASKACSFLGMMQVSVSSYTQELSAKILSGRSLISPYLQVDMKATAVKPVWRVVRADQTYSVPTLLCA